MWQDCKIYSIDEHRFLTNDEVKKIEAAREAAYQEQRRLIEEQRHK